MGLLGGNKKNKASQIFETLADLGSLFMAGIYILYVLLLLIFGLGTRWLNWCMFLITLIYIMFFAAKIISLNRILEKKGVARRARFILRYSKWAMKLINALFVVIAIATTRNSDEDSVIMMVGVFVVGFSFLVSVLWDVCWFVVRRKMRDLKENWDNLSRDDKNRHVENILDSFIHGIDNITGVNISESVAVTAGGRRKKKSDPTSTQENPKTEESGNTTENP